MLFSSKKCVTSDHRLHIVFLSINCTCIICKSQQLLALDLHKRPRNSKEEVKNTCRPKDCVQSVQILHRQCLLTPVLFSCFQHQLPSSGLSVRALTLIASRWRYNSLLLTIFWNADSTFLKYHFNHQRDHFLCIFINCSLAILVVLTREQFSPSAHRIMEEYKWFTVSFNIT